MESSIFYPFILLALILPIIFYFVLKYITIKIKLNCFLALPIISIIFWFIAFLTYFKITVPEIELDSMLLVLSRTGMTIFAILPLILISIVMTLIGYFSIKYGK